MQIGIVGAGRFGSTTATLWASAGHEVLLSFASDRHRLEQLAAVVAPREAAKLAVMVMISVPSRSYGRRDRDRRRE